MTLLDVDTVNTLVLEGAWVLFQIDYVNTLHQSKPPGLEACSAPGGEKKNDLAQAEPALSSSPLPAIMAPRKHLLGWVSKKEGNTTQWSKAPPLAFSQPKSKSGYAILGSSVTLSQVCKKNLPLPQFPQM